MACNTTITPQLVEAASPKKHNKTTCKLVIHSLGFSASKASDFTPKCGLLNLFEHMLKTHRTKTNRLGDVSTNIWELHFPQCVRIANMQHGVGMGTLSIEKSLRIWMLIAGEYGHS
jgi:hypothetical protein